MKKVKWYTNKIIEIQDIDLLEKWKEKAKTSKYYENAINTWTVRDTKKLKYVNAHRLNYFAVYGRNGSETIESILKEKYFKE